MESKILEKEMEIRSISINPKLRRIHFPGIWPLPLKGLSSKLEEKLIKDRPRFKIDMDIAGGIRHAHLHLNDEIILLDKDVLSKHAEGIARELMEDFTEQLR